MTEMKPQTRRTNRVFKSLHKPLTYQGVERTLFLPKEGSNFSARQAECLEACEGQHFPCGYD